MSRSVIQFNKGISLPEFQRLYGSDAQCEAALEMARWPDGFRGPRCYYGREHGLVYGRRLKRYQCRSCGCQSTLTAGTIMQATKLPLTTWFLAFYLIGQAKLRSPRWSSAATLASTTTPPDCCTTRSCAQCLSGRRLTCCWVRSRWMKPTLADNSQAARRVGDQRT